MISDLMEVDDTLGLSTGVPPPKVVRNVHGDGEVRGDDSCPQHEQNNHQRQTQITPNSTTHPCQETNSLISDSSDSDINRTTKVTKPSSVLTSHPRLCLYPI
ncbi:unnamed protein product [Ambrosiozyma monospora]|uniref:Unnamed protein product n=1 Tax=Ambrosiozyma monospora TaxID=43982 RepID=A0A9W6SWH6_AMBMO|nr:unnamed protein product [Ambrosiozyma monospora]